MWQRSCQQCQLLQTCRQIRSQHHLQSDVPEDQIKSVILSTQTQAQWQRALRWRFGISVSTLVSVNELALCPAWSIRVQKKTFLEKTQPTGFWVLLGFGLYCSDFLLEWAVGKLVGWFSSSAKLLFRFTSTLDYLKICTFYSWSLEAVNIKKSLIITNMTN